MPRTKRVTDGMVTRKRREKRKRESERKEKNSVSNSEETDVQPEPCVQQDGASTLSESVNVGQGGGDRDYVL